MKIITQNTYKNLFYIQRQSFLKDKNESDKSLTKKVRNILINKLHHIDDKNIFEKLLKMMENKEHSTR